MLMYRITGQKKVCIFWRLYFRPLIILDCSVLFEIVKTAIYRMRMLKIDKAGFYEEGRYER